MIRDEPCIRDAQPSILGKSILESMSFILQIENWVIPSGRNHRVYSFVAGHLSISMY